ncbi:hypothetical protein [Serratia symbiotica]|uniref:hypothetical protein n=1 Tax=Serratia symbiotica TaxID=138074 RepID=UPI0004ABFA9B
MRCAKKRNDNLARWVNALEARQGFLEGTVALANKLTRIVWRVMTDAVDFSVKKAFSMN